MCTEMSKLIFRGQHLQFYVSLQINRNIIFTIYITYIESNYTFLVQKKIMLLEKRIKFVLKYFLNIIQFYLHIKYTIIHNILMTRARRLMPYKIPK